MKSLLWSAFILASVAVPVAVEGTQNAEPSKVTTIELTGCISINPVAGQYTFVDGVSGGAYRLNGRDVKKYAGQRVTLVGDPSSKRVRVRFGLWPSPNVAGQAGALDPAQESIARQPGGAAAGATESKLPELRVVRMRGLEGSCR